MRSLVYFLLIALLCTCYSDLENERRWRQQIFENCVGKLPPPISVEDLKTCTDITNKLLPEKGVPK